MPKGVESKKGAALKNGVTKGAAARKGAKGSGRGSWKWQVGLVLAAVVAALAPVPATLIERVYSTSVYRIIQRVVTPASNAVPFPLFDALIGITVAVWLLLLVLDVRRRSWLRVAGRLVKRTAALAAAFYLGFLLVWGLNYRRVKLADKLQFSEAAISPEAALAAAVTTVEQLNALHARAHETGWRKLEEVAPDLASAFARADRGLGSRTAPVPARPKTTLLDLYFRRAGVEGMTDPYFLETLVQRQLLPFERPFVVAHEWSHLAGYADESEANFVGWLTCLGGSVADQYSGWLFLYGELSRAIRDRDRALLSAQLAAGPRADLNAMAERYRRNVSPRVSTAGWRVYDRYLKANRVDAGTASYGQVVRLVLGVRFGPDWMPLLKGAPAPSAAGYPRANGVIARSSVARGSLR